MTPFMQFRLWLREGPAPERVASVVVAVVLAALLVYTAVPSSTGSEAVATGVSNSGVAEPGLSASGGSGSTGPASGNTGSASKQVPVGSGSGSQTGSGSGGSGSGSGGASGGGSVGVASGSGSVGGGGPGSGSAGSGGSGTGAGGGSSGGSGGSGTGSGGGTCSGLTSTDQGITPTEIKIDVALFSLEGSASNSFIGVPSPQAQEADYQAVFNAINKAGGIQCRRIVAGYYTANFLDASQQHTVCLNMVSDKVFAVLDGVALDSNQAGRDCVAQAHIPLFDSGAILGSEAAGSLYPYLFSASDQWNYAIRDSIFGAKNLGWFNGYHKVGVLEDDCYPEVNRQVLQNLGQIGIASKDIVTFDFTGCSTVPSPQDIEQAEFNFQTSGVTNVLDLSQVPKSGYFSKVAAAQAYHPKYDVSGGAPSVFQGQTGSSAGPNPQNYNGGISITELATGAENTPGLAFSPATTACNKIMSGAGLPSVQQSGAYEAGTICDLVWMFQLAAERAQPLVRTNLVNGLDRAGQWLQSFPNGLANFRSGEASAGEYWREDVYQSSCSCFKVAAATASWQPNL